MQNNNKIQLCGFNNLTKTLSFNLYDVSYVQSDADKAVLREQINREYNSARLTEILTRVASIIGANVLNVATADYEPSGASTTLLISEETPALAGVTNQPTPGPLPEMVVAHLDKSHLTAHTYPENESFVGPNVLRTDIDVSTCGMISPLKALNFLIHSFKSDVVVLDYRVRGFTRDTNSNKLFIDHDISSICEYIGEDVLQQFISVDHNMPECNIFHSRLMRKPVDIDRFLLGAADPGMTEEDIRSEIQKELNGIYQDIPN